MSVSDARRRRIAVKSAMWVACLAPALSLGVAALTNGLGANPIEELTHRTGKTTLVLLLVTLSITPLKAVTGVGALISLRRMLGLFAFFYVCIHFLTYLVLAVVLMRPLGVAGLALASSIAPFVGSGLLLVSLTRRVGRPDTQGWPRTLAGLAVGTVVLIVATRLTGDVVVGWLGDQSETSRTTSL